MPRVLKGSRGYKACRVRRVSKALRVYRALRVRRDLRGLDYR